ncbi:GAF domain-containing sensor histidine kinase [Actinoplanes sp. NPDC051861]|uniref:GAF domain-containing sensor histidine kinase n=1 Tax=Actinoplanes sp. NPDC051861 TaxID=3155170 RepID=UPI00343D3D35
MRAETRAADDGVYERRRLSVLRGYHILDTPAETDFDDIVALAAQLCGTPISSISLIDEHRQWFKARVGLDASESDRASSFCGRAMYGDDVTQIPDARLDQHYATSPMVTGEPYIRFYAGAPLISPHGEPLGTLCVADPEPGMLSPAQQHGLRALARHVVSQLELRRYARDIRDLNERLRDAESVKDEFISRVTHELRTPLSSIHGYLEVLGDPELPEETRAGFLHRIRRNSDRLLTLVDDMLIAAQVSAESRSFERRSTDLAVLVSTAAEQNRPLIEARGLTVEVHTEPGLIADVDSCRLGQAVDRLILNAVKFTDHGGLTISTRREGEHALIRITDTGSGISPADRERVLAPFRRSAAAERAEVQGIGLGLSIVKAIVDGHRGRISIDGAPGAGTTVSLELPIH